MEKEFFIRLLDHEKWANEAVLKCVLSAGEMPDRVEDVFSHMLNAQQVWYDRAKEQEPKTAVWQHVSHNQWKSRIETHHREWKELVENTSDFNKTIEYQNSKGDSFTSSISDILTHLSLHSQYHRGQITVLIKPYVEKLPATDFIFWSRNS